MRGAVEMQQNGVRAARDVRSDDVDALMPAIFLRDGNDLAQPCFVTVDGVRQRMMLDDGRDGRVGVALRGDCRVHGPSPRSGTLEAELNVNENMPVREGFLATRKDRSCARVMPIAYSLGAERG